VYRDPQTNARMKRGFKSEKAAWSFYNRVTDDREALRCGSATARQIAVGARGLTVLDACIEEYERDMRARRLTEPHVRNSRQILDRAVKACGWSAVRTIAPAAAMAWLGKFTPATANGYLRIIRAFTHWLAKQNYSPEDLLIGVERVRVGIAARPKRALTFEEFDSLVTCAKIRPWRRLWYRLSARLGLRHREIARLTWSAIDFENAVLVVTPDIGKSNRTDLIPIEPTLLEDLRRLRQAPATKLFKSRVHRRVWRNDLTRAGIEFEHERGGAHLSSLRKTLATHMAMSGVHPQITQAAMRHSDIKLTTNIYTDAKLLNVRQAMGALGNPIKKGERTG